MSGEGIELAEGAGLFGRLAAATSAEISSLESAGVQAVSKLSAGEVDATVSAQKVGSGLSQEASQARTAAKFEEEAQAAPRSSEETSRLAIKEREATIRSGQRWESATRNAAKAAPKVLGVAIAAPALVGVVGNLISDGEKAIQNVGQAIGKAIGDVASALARLLGGGSDTANSIADTISKIIEFVVDAVAVVTIVYGGIQAYRLIRYETSKAPAASK